MEICFLAFVIRLRVDVKMFATERRVRRTIKLKPIKVKLQLPHTKSVTKCSPSIISIFFVVSLYLPQFVN